MDIGALRIAGIVVSGALIGAAALFATTTSRPTLPRTVVPSPPPVMTTTPQTFSSPSFAISLRGDGPLARAQRLAMRGGHGAAARRQVARELTRQRAFRGLCFERFTSRGDIVVRACEGTTAADWQAQLREMPAVTNVDAIDQSTQDGRGE